MMLLIAAALSITAVLFLPSCADPKGSATAPSASTSGGVDSHGLHVLNNARLREIMRRLGGMDFDNMLLEIEAVGAVQRDICEVSSLAAELAGDAKLIPILLKDVEMNEESHRVMRALSARLHDESLELKHYADVNDARMIKVKIDEMVATCNACHASFRAPAVAIRAAPPSSLFASDY